MDLVFQNSTPDKKYSSKFFEKILIVGIKELKLADKNIEVSVNLVGEGKIKELNGKYRRKNKVTDVLSFPIEPKPIQKTKIWPIGDIFLCLSFAKKQAKSENVSIGYRLAQLTVHGFLHLLGYDHPDDKVSGPRLKRRGEKMFELENKILKKCQDKGQFVG